MSEEDPLAEVPEEHPVVLFDGVCNLCNWFVQFLIRNDPAGTFRFAPLQSEVGEALLAEYGLPTDRMASVVLVDGGETYTESDAALRIASLLGGVYTLFVPFKVVPRPVRDAVYAFVADHRYGWFGKKDRCMTPTPDVRSRFLAGDPTTQQVGDEGE